MAAHLPLDAWERVLGHFDVSQAVGVFDVLWQAGVFGRVPRLDVFWIVIASARHRGACEREAELPDPEPYRGGVAALVEMGVDKTRATAVMRGAHGSWAVAMRQLGWD